MTGRDLVAWLTANDALDLPVVLRGFVDVDDGDFIQSINTEAGLDASHLLRADAEVTVWCP